jgi:hypothetical protein
VTLPGVIAAVLRALLLRPVAGRGAGDLAGDPAVSLALVLIAMEIFVLPGFGVVGVSAQSCWCSARPGDTGRSSRSVAGVGAVRHHSADVRGQPGWAMIAGFTFIWYLLNIPYLNRLMLAGAHSTVRRPLEPSQPLARLLGDISGGDPLRRPGSEVRRRVCGRRLGRQFRPRGDVQVVEIEGTRIVVKEV